MEQGQTNLQEIDLNNLLSYMGSYDYTVPTRSILDLEKVVQEWVMMNDCGAIIYGESRAGKTRAIRYISNNLRNKYGADLPIYVYTATDQVATQKTFYSGLLLSLKHEEAHKGTAVQMRQRIVNRIIANASDTKYRRAILFIDEAYLLSIKEYNWLIDIYNELNLNSILLTVFLVGTRELKEQKSGFIRAKKQQIVLRFMVKEFEFKGLTCERDAAICLASIDKPFRPRNTASEINLLEVFFPEAFKDGIKLSDFAKDIWEAFETVKTNNNINSGQVLMKHFIDAIIHCMRKYGSLGANIYAPGTEEWIDSIIGSGFISSQETL